MRNISFPAPEKGNGENGSTRVRKVFKWFSEFLSNSDLFCLKTFFIFQNLVFRKNNVQLSASYVNETQSTPKLQATFTTFNITICQFCGLDFFLFQSFSQTDASILH